MGLFKLALSQKCPLAVYHGLLCLLFLSVTCMPSNPSELLLGDEKTSNSDSEPLIREKRAQENYCLEPACIHAASRMLKKINFNVKPCENFYEFACGTQVEETFIPDEKTSVTLFTKIGDKLNLQLRKLLAEDIKEDDPKPFRIVKQYYAACMDKESIESNSKESLRNLQQSFGAWPMISEEGWDEDSWSWAETVKTFRANGISSDFIFDVSVYTDVKNTKRKQMSIDQPTGILVREFFVKGWDEPNVKAYYDYMLDIVSSLGANGDRIEEDCREIVDFEIEMANISMSREERRNSSLTYNVYKLGDLDQIFPYLEWNSYLSSMVSPPTALDDEEEINVRDVGYFEEFGSLLERTPKRIIANFLYWRFTASSISYLSDELKNKALKFNKKVYGRNQREPRWKECIELIQRDLSTALSAMYIRSYFDESSKLNSLELVKNLLAEFESRLRTVTWMDPKTRAEALRKLKKIHSHIGYPDELRNDAVLEAYYANLDISESELFDTHLKANKFYTDKHFERLREPVDRDDWRDLSNVAIVNAFYNRVSNYIQFPAGILQDHFFHASHPKYLNYAAIGSVIGHEITHGFDDQGSQFDEDGELKNWWNEKTSEEFKNRAKCMIEQYGNFVENSTGLNLNGVNTQGENIADNGGIVVSYRAYQRIAGKVEQRLPGLSYTTNQLFWIAVAQTWCAKYRKETLKYMLASGYHPPGEFRVLGPFRNNKDFARDFSCPVGSPMNPKHKCIVW